MDDFTAHEHPRRARRHAQGLAANGVSLPEPLLAAGPYDEARPSQAPQPWPAPTESGAPAAGTLHAWTGPVSPDPWNAPPAPAPAPGPAPPVNPDPNPAMWAAPVQPSSWTTSPPWTFGIDPRRVSALLWKILAALVVLDFLGSVGAAVGVPYTITRFVDADDKINIPTGFKTTMLLVLTLLLWAHWSVARSRRNRFERGWLLLTFVAAFAFVDETTYLHQSLGEFVHDHVHTHGVLRFAWVVVYLPAVLVVAVIVLRYMRYLNSALRVRLLLGGLAYGAGAVALEPIKSAAADSVGDGSLAFKLVAAVSDSLEMLGLTVLVVVLLADLAHVASVVVVDLRDDPPAGSGPALAMAAGQNGGLARGNTGGNPSGAAPNPSGRRAASHSTR